MARKRKSDVYLDEETLPENNVSIQLLFGEINEDSCFDVCAWILNANCTTEGRPKNLSLMINSFGGDMHCAFAIIEMMRGSKIPVSTVALGQIASAGLMIFMAGEKGQRIITPSCSIMSHNYSTGISGDHHVLLNIQRELNMNHDRMVQHYKNCTNQPDEFITQKLLGPQDFFMTPDEAVKYGFGDRIATL